MPYPCHCYRQYMYVIPRPYRREYIHAIHKVIYADMYICHTQVIYLYADSIYTSIHAIPRPYTCHTQAILETVNATPRPYSRQYNYISHTQTIAMHLRRYARV